jgi:hypothetical protein
MIQGQIDTSYQTLQRDLFESGLAARIGSSAFVVWSAIKTHADYNNGVCWPGIRKLMKDTGLASATVQNAIATLETERLLRSRRGKGQRILYVARERLDVRLGNRVVCSIVIDYIPTRLREQLHQIRRALEAGGGDHEVFAQVEIIPGPGFVWNEHSNSLVAHIPGREAMNLDSTTLVANTSSPLVQKVTALRERVSPLVVAKQ